MNVPSIISALLESFDQNVPPSIGEVLVTATRLLSANVEAQTARIEAEVLLGHCLGLNRAQLYARLNDVLPSEDLSACISLIERRLTGEPVAYITGHREFYGLDFQVDPRVLIPRPETELIVEAVLGRFEGRPDQGVTIADVGTGSGAIAISLAVNLPMARVIGVDRSSDALAVAAMNVARHGVGERVHLAHGDLLEPIHDRLDVVVANLPYIPCSRLGSLQRDVREFEPLGALDGGEDGLDYYRRLLPQARVRLSSPGLILMEIDPEQQEAMEELVHRHFPTATIDVLKDYAGLDRVVSVDIGCFCLEPR